ncbi:MAG: hypothetical protein R2822_19995 [Spirosomataceae bacterium]
MKTIISTMLFVSIFSHAFTQHLPSVLPEKIKNHSKYIFDLTKGNQLTIYARSIQDLEKFQNVDSTVALFLKDYQTIQSTLTENTNAKVLIYRFLEQGRYQLDLKEHPSTHQRFQFDSNGQEPVLIKTLQDTLLITQTFLKPQPSKSGEVQQLNEQIYFCFVLNNLEDLNSIIESGRINSQVRQAIEDAKKYHYHQLTDDKFIFTYKRENDVNDSFKNVNNKGGDMLAIHPSFGAGVIQNQLVPNLMADFTLILNPYKRIGYTVGWRSSFFTGRNDLTNRLTTETNGFLHAGVTFYGFQKSSPRRIDTQHVLFGAYLGRLMNKNTAIFPKNTWNLSLTISTKGMFKIQPEVYFNGFFKQAVPGLRVQIGI